METAAEHQWFLRKHEDGTVFGPLGFEQLAQWAASAQIAPHDSVSTDQENWVKAPMLPELAMDWIVEVTSERYYGPTTLGAINEFIRLGEINEDTFVVNACDGSRRRLGELAPLLESEAARTPAPAGEPMGDSGSFSPAASGISIDPEERIRELEQALEEERRALAEAEERYRELESKYTDLLNAAAASEP